MKKRRRQNPLKETAKNLTELATDEELKYRPVFDKLKVDAEKLNSVSERIDFWRKQKAIYLSGISQTTFVASGVMSFHIPNKELFMDRLISIEIERLEKLLPDQTKTKSEDLSVECRTKRCDVFHNRGLVI